MDILWSVIYYVICKLQLVKNSEFQQENTKFFGMSFHNTLKGVSGESLTVTLLRKTAPRSLQITLSVGTSNTAPRVPLMKLVSLRLTLSNTDDTVRS